MEKIIVYSDQALNDIAEITDYMLNNWPKEVAINFERSLSAKLFNIARHPYIGHKRSKYSRFRQTIIAKHYILFYSIKSKVIEVYRVKHAKMK